MPSTSSFELRDSTLVGRLSFPDYSPANPAEDAAWQKKVYLYVGRHQRLTGEVKKLAKPLGLIRRRVKGHSNGEVTDEDELEILEIVSWKIVFSSRPEPVGAGTE
ncbi:hypothetical protein MMC13_000658 [Lambiella insularis]|nr:hypothetical protein [Lambiella insularis]